MTGFSIELLFDLYSIFIVLLHAKGCEMLGDSFIGGSENCCIFQTYFDVAIGGKGVDYKANILGALLTKSATWTSE